MWRILATGLALALVATLPAADPEALHIVQWAFEADDANAKLAQSYTFHERMQQTMFNKKGEARETKSKTYDVTLLDGSEYKRLIAKNDQPLSEKEEAAEERKLQKNLERMRNETPKQREKRLRKIEKKREEERKFIAEVTRAFEFRLAGAEEVDGIASYVIDAEPRPDYRPAFRKAGILKKLRGTLWISKEDFGWVKADIDTIEDFSWGLFVVKLKRGAKIRFTQRYVNDEVWLVDNWNVRLQGRAALVAKFHGEFSGAYSNFRKFSTESSVTYGDAVE